MLVEEILGRSPDAVLVGDTPTALALRDRTSTVPIVFAGLSDPVGTGLVRSLARPGGNITGFESFEFTMIGKWMEMLQMVVPTTNRVAILYNPATAHFIMPYVGQAQRVAAALGLTMVAAPAMDPEVTNAVFAAMATLPGGGVIVIPDAYNYAEPERRRLIALAARHRLPAIYAYSGYASDGGLMSYGPSQLAQYIEAAGYIDRIFRGATPADLPVQGPIRFDLVLNVRAAKALDVTFPSQLLARATRIIQ